MTTMTDKIKFNKENFEELWGSICLDTSLALNDSLKEIGNPRDVATIAVIDGLASYLAEVLAEVEKGKKIIWHEFMCPPILFRGFPGVHPVMAETMSGVLPVLDPEGLVPYLDAGAEMVTNEVCPAAVGFLGCLVKEVCPPCDMIVMPVAPCDSFNISYQIVPKLLDAPMHILDIPYWQDEPSIDYYTGLMWKMIRDVEDTLKVKMDWDLCRESIKLANETLDYWKAENEMRKITPCPHGGKVNFYAWLLYLVAAGTPYARDSFKRVLEDSRQLALQKKGCIEGGEKARLLFYNPDPFYDAPIHDWLEDEYRTVTVFNFFGHAVPTWIDPSTPETIVRDCAWHSMNCSMARQYRGPMEYFMDDFVNVLDNWNIDAVVVPALLECKHGQATHGFVRDACRERGKPLLLAEFSPMDPRPVSIDKLRDMVAEFLETQVFPLK
jgi:benzoyl-CoA reductase/2-hydroxyglutaryl-CoA dehydratase subunit BcrC/BadD/HgdB